MKTIVIIIILSIAAIQITFSQLYNPNVYNCEEIENPPEFMQITTGGQFKPECIGKYTTDPQATFKVLIVFVRFQNDEGPEADYWLKNSTSGPTYIDYVISNQKRTSTNWWDAYYENTETLSDFWMEASRNIYGTGLHITGQAVSIILDHEFTYYQSTNGGHGMGQINDEIYTKLQSYGSLINWPSYDKWTGANGSFTYGEGDGYVDMIYKVFRSHNPGIGMPAGGVAMLYDSYLYPSSEYPGYPIYSNGSQTIYVNGGYGSIGSGLTMSPGHYGTEGEDNYGRYYPLTKLGMISFSEHEHGHYLFGGDHSMYGKMSGLGADFGVDEFLSPWESIKLGYITPQVVDFNNPPPYNLYSIGDFSSRGSSEGQVLQVPILPNESFLIALRNKVSKYDVIMWGDTARGVPYRNINPDYGKGIYIYHAPSGLQWPTSMDQECADGLWNYTQAENGWEYPDWEPSDLLPYYKKSIPRFFVNDNSSYDDKNNPGTIGFENKDGKSVNKAFYDEIHNRYYYHNSWFGIGKKHTCYNTCTGTDRVYTNLEEVWTSREFQGDRWDPWKIGYNQVFSPYSSPSTANFQASGLTGIFIYLESQNNESANFKIYKVGEGDYSEDLILSETPPSKPMMYPYYSVVECNGVYACPQIIWANNKEPDMIRIDANNNAYKKYKIYRAYSGFLNPEIPTNYYYLDTYNDYSINDTEPNDTASYIDRNQVLIYCGGSKPPSTGECFRYIVEAVDKDDLPSVKSDFIHVKGYLGLLPDKFVNYAPDIYSLSQNYPNPFNPTTEIKFSIAYSSNVTLKVYNLLGEEIAVLINNEYKEKGNHSVRFDGSNLSSGVYFYKLEAGNFVQSRKMVLIK